MSDGSIPMSDCSKGPIIPPACSFSLLRCGRKGKEFGALLYPPSHLSITRIITMAESFSDFLVISLMSYISNIGGL